MSEDGIESLSRKRVAICLLLGFAFSFAKRYVVMLFYDPDENRGFSGKKYFEENLLNSFSDEVISVPHAALQ